MRARRWLRAGAGAGAVALGLALTSCASIPSHGQVRETTPTAASSQEEFIRVLARPPRDGAGPGEIVSGFLAASASFDGDHTVARTYLTTAASAGWQPGDHVAIYESTPGYRLSGGATPAADPTASSTVTMKALHAAGTIDARGQFSQPLSTGPFTEKFTLHKVAGQWRIDTLPQGLVLGTGDVTRAYRSINLYFTDISGGVLVPDPIFLPAQQPGIATTLVRELLQGPTAWLAPAVDTGFPRGTRLAVDAVPIENGVARVDLGASALTATADARRDMAAQLSYLLQQLDGVSGVRITVRGVPFTVSGSAGVTREADWPELDPAARPLDPTTYLLTAGHLSLVSGTSVRVVDGYFGRELGLRAAGTALDGTSIAGSYLDGGGDVVRVGPAGAATVTTVYRGGDVASLSWDRFGVVWIVDVGPTGAGVWTARPGRAQHRVTVRGLAGRTVELLRVSRDGTRAALVVRTRTGARQLVLARIERPAATPEDTVISGLRRVESSLNSVGDVGWAGATTLLASGRQGSAPLQMYTVDVGGFSVATVGSVPQLATVAACPGRPFLAGTLNNVIWSDRGSGWRTYVKGRVPIYPG